MSLAEPSPASLATVHARRHPFVVVAVAFARALAGIALAWPVASLVRSTYAGHPLGDRVLFEPGALELVDFVARVLGPMGALLEAYALVAVFVAVVEGAVVFAATLSALQLAHEGGVLRRARGALQHGLRFAPGLGAQWTATLVLQGLVVGAGAMLAGAVAHALAARSGDPTADRIAAVALLPFALAVLVLSVIRDVAAVERVTRDASAFASFVAAARAVARRPAYIVDYAWRGATGLATTGLVALAALRLGGRPGIALVVLTIFHALALGLRSALRVSWLAAAIRRARATRA